MNESSSKGRLIRLILFAALAAGLFFLWRSSNSPIAKLFAMVFGVLLCETVLALILGLFKPQAHRARTILSITVSLTFRPYSSGFPVSACASAVTFPEGRVGCTPMFTTAGSVLSSVLILHGYTPKAGSCFFQSRTSRKILI